MDISTVAIAVAIVLGSVAVIGLIGALVCFFMTFYNRSRKPLGADEYEFPPGRIYEAHYDDMRAWTDDIRRMPREEVSILSHDGLTLRGRYYECIPDGPMEIMFHGYRGNAERDLCGGVARAFALGHNVLIVDHRASGTSDGHVISFGINEKKDCLRWLEFALEHYGKDRKIMLTGISMGAATVMMAGGCDLPENVVYILADCGYSSTKEIIKKVIKEDIRLPATPLYPFVKLGARLYGRFDLEEDSPMEAMQRCRVPVIFAHGDTDAFVPCDMSRRLYEACASEKKKLVIIPGAGHGLCFPHAQEDYVNALKEAETEFGFRKW